MSARWGSGTVRPCPVREYTRRDEAEARPGEERRDRAGDEEPEEQCDDPPDECKGGSDEHPQQTAPERRSRDTQRLCDPVIRLYCPPQAGSP